MRGCRARRLGAWHGRVLQGGPSAGDQAQAGEARQGRGRGLLGVRIGSARCCAPLRRQVRFERSTERAAWRAEAGASPSPCCLQLSPSPRACPQWCRTGSHGQRPPRRRRLRGPRAPGRRGAWRSSCSAAGGEGARSWQSQSVSEFRSADADPASGCLRGGEGRRLPRDDRRASPGLSGHW
jgi:hypothetical protein